MNITLVVIGIVILVLGFFAGAYTTTQSQLWGLVSTTSTPYAPYGIPLVVGGIVMIIVGALIGNKK